MELLESFDKVLKEFCNKTTDDYIKEVFDLDEKYLLVKKDVLESLVNRLRPLEGYCGLVLENIDKLGRDKLLEYKSLVAENLLMKLEMYTMTGVGNFKMVPGIPMSPNESGKMYSTKNIVCSILESIQCDLIKKFEI